MERPIWIGVRAIVLAIAALLLLPFQAQAERNWEFSVGAFGGKALHSNESVKISEGSLIGGDTFTDGTANGVKLNDAPTFGGKLTAWHLPRQYKWQPQIGLELDWTRFTADLHPQTVGAAGTVNIPGFELGSLTFFDPQDFSVDVLAANLLFRYPIGATPEMPQGRWYPCIYDFFRLSGNQLLPGSPRTRRNKILPDKEPGHLCRSETDHGLERV